MSKDSGKLPSNVSLLADERIIRRARGGLIFRRMLAPVAGEFVLTSQRLLFERLKFPFPHWWALEPHLREFGLEDIVAIDRASFLDRVSFGGGNGLRLLMTDGRTISMHVREHEGWTADISQLSQQERGDIAEA